MTFFLYGVMGQGTDPLFRVEAERPSALHERDLAEIDEVVERSSRDAQAPREFVDVDQTFVFHGALAAQAGARVELSQLNGLGGGHHEHANREEQGRGDEEADKDAP